MNGKTCQIASDIMRTILCVKNLSWQEFFVYRATRKHDYITSNPEQIEFKIMLYNDGMCRLTMTESMGISSVRPFVVSTFKGRSEGNILWFRWIPRKSWK